MKSMKKSTLLLLSLAIATSALNGATVPATQTNPVEIAKTALIGSKGVVVYYNSTYTDGIQIVANLQSGTRTYNLGPNTKMVTIPFGPSEDVVLKLTYKGPNYPIEKTIKAQMKGPSALIYTKRSSSTTDPRPTTHSLEMFKSGGARVYFSVNGGPMKNNYLF